MLFILLVCSFFYVETNKFELDIFQDTMIISFDDNSTFRIDEKQDNFRFEVLKRDGKWKNITITTLDNKEKSIDALRLGFNWVRYGQEEDE